MTKLRKEEIKDINELLYILDIEDKESLTKIMNKFGFKKSESSKFNSFTLNHLNVAWACIKRIKIILNNYFKNKKNMEINKTELANYIQEMLIEYTRDTFRKNCLITEQMIECFS